VINHYTGETSIWTNAYIQELVRMEKITAKGPLASDIRVISCEDDEVVPTKRILDYYGELNIKIQVIPHGSHRMTDMEPAYRAIEKMLLKIRGRTDFTHDVDI
jgi:predicted esterase YcpF (UPF0227 family)